jgi:8-oxo-dGTP pyrophosphatase MutT (NUDIX family)
VISALRDRLASRPRRVAEIPPGHAPAAVLVPLVERDGELRVVFTERARDLHAHAGQVSFPGGRCEPVDADRAATALREAEEEIGIPRGTVEVLGLLDDFVTPTGFVITPVVGRVAPAPAYRPEPAEVREVFEVGLERLRDPTLLHDVGAIVHAGRSYPIIAYRPDGRNIWGITARILQELLALV